MTAADWFALDMLWEIERLLDVAVEPPKEES
jgi:hypothetical protein